MQEAAKSSVLVPLLLEQIFERFSCVEDKLDKENFLLDLHKLFGGSLVAAALYILDHQNIVVSTNYAKTIQIGEIYKCSLPLAHFFININYCTCKYFQERVLIKEITFTGPYTCQHMLAARLAITLQHKCLSFKEVPTHELDVLLSSFIPLSLQED